ncbi:MAG TPA: glycosyltransferase family 2 protein [Polyangiaceae bacterium]|nr:glycosyltransferase family 2 protein [Polyangiaceae bacterium]
MKLYGIWVAQNEADILRHTFDFHRRTRHFDRIFFYDLGSEDDTLEIAREYADIADVERRRTPYSGELRVALMDEHRDRYAPGDWVAIIDSDEIYAEDPRAAIRAAEAERATRIETWQAQYYFTDLDLAAWERGDAAWRATSAYERLKHYVVNWSEMRFYKALAPAGGRTSVVDLDGKLASRKLLNRHFPYRSPEQIGEKVRVRLANRKTGLNTQYQIFSEDWRRYVVDHRLLHRDDGVIRFGVPEGVDWKSFYNFWANDAASWKNPVYNNWYIYWLMVHGFLPRWSPPEMALKAVGKAVQRIRGRHQVARA